MHRHRTKNPKFLKKQKEAREEKEERKSWFSRIEKIQKIPTYNEILEVKRQHEKFLEIQKKQLEDAFNATGRNPT